MSWNVTCNARLYALALTAAWWTVYCLPEAIFVYVCWNMFTATSLDSRSYSCLLAEDARHVHQELCDEYEHCLYLDSHGGLAMSHYYCFLVVWWNEQRGLQKAIVVRWVFCALWKQETFSEIEIAGILRHRWCEWYKSKLCFARRLKYEPSFFQERFYGTKSQLDRICLPVSCNQSRLFTLIRTCRTRNHGRGACY